MENNLSSLELIELIEIIESPHEYQKEFINLVYNELDIRGITEQNKNIVAIMLFRKKLNKLFETKIYVTKDYELPSSVLISEKEKLKLFKVEYKSFKSKREMLNDNLEAYIAGI